VCDGEAAKSTPFDGGPASGSGKVNLCTPSAWSERRERPVNKSMANAPRVCEQGSTFAAIAAILGSKVPLRVDSGKGRLARRMPRRHDEHTLDGGNVSPLALPWQQTDEPDDGATHLGTLNTSAPTRREQQHNQPNDDDR
jgi:hypothetical protein